MSPEQLRFSKLPKWAQEHINDLMRQRIEAVTALRRYLDNQTASSLYVAEYHSIGEQIGPTHAKQWIQADNVTFQLNGGEVSIRAEHGFDHLRVMSHHDGLAVSPVASNVITIRQSKPL